MKKASLAPEKLRQELHDVRIVCIMKIEKTMDSRKIIQLLKKSGWEFSRSAFLAEAALHFGKQFGNHAKIA